jgi:hypothetical protein
LKGYRSVPVVTLEEADIHETHHCKQHGGLANFEAITSEAQSTDAF